MATIDNRSHYVVTVSRRDELCRHFAYHQLAHAKAYFAQLAQSGFKPQVTQREDKILVRIRDKGYAHQTGRFDTMAKALDFVKAVEVDRAKGLDNNYLKARNVTFVALLERYMNEEGPVRMPKSWDTVDKYRCQKIWRGATGQFNARDRADIAKRLGVSVAELPATLQPDYPWMQKPFSAMTTVDIESFIPERQEDGVSNATIDRELDLISAVCNVAIKVWDYDVKKNPMTNVRRPKYFNERDRRLKGREEARLFQAARNEDRRRCEEVCLSELVSQALADDAIATDMSPSNKRRRIQALHRTLAEQARRECIVVPFMASFVAFQLGTAARRGEALALLWEHVDFDKPSAHFPMTKNGRPRTVPLMRQVVDALDALPRTQGRVFEMSVDYVKNAWQRVLDEAGIEDLHIHDLRHEAISRIAETGKFTVIDLQSISGHMDARMLLRYSHLCMGKLAARLDEAFTDEQMSQVHRGRVRLSSRSEVTMRDVIESSLAFDCSDGTAVIALGVPPRAKNEREVSAVVAVDFKQRRRIA